MNKKTERIAIIGLAAFLVGYFAYQAAYGTNETKESCLHMLDHFFYLLSHQDQMEEDICLLTTSKFGILPILLPSLSLLISFLL